MGENIIFYSEDYMSMGGPCASIAPIIGRTRNSGLGHRGPKRHLKRWLDSPDTAYSLACYRY